MKANVLFFDKKPAARASDSLLKCQAITCANPAMHFYWRFSARIKCSAWKNPVFNASRGKESINFLYNQKENKPKLSIN